MNNELMIERLKGVGVKFTEGLTEEEFVKIEEIYGFTFPREIKSFFSCGLPVSGGFYNWRNFSDENIEYIKSFDKKIEEAFLFDIQNNNLLDYFKELTADVKNDEDKKKVVLEYLHQSKKLIPFLSHRCFFDGMDNMPIVSFWQPTDVIYYGSSLENYLENEFFEKKPIIAVDERMKETGIWYYLIW